MGTGLLLQAETKLAMKNKATIANWGKQVNLFIASLIIGSFSGILRGQPI
jgi:hypothetical protein